jgi:hypothetical protein
MATITLKQVSRGALSVIISGMETKVLVVAIIKNGDFILMRKKPDGSPPYKETWYLFGADVSHNTDPDQEIKKLVKSQAGIDIEVKTKFS